MAFPPSAMAYPPHGLHRPMDEHDACGFGMIAQLDDHASGTTIKKALSALMQMTHRGGVAVDGVSGDGCGLLMRQPEQFLRTVAHEANITLTGHFAAGNVFLPNDAAQAEQCRQTLAQVLHQVGIHIRGWRKLPINRSVCGPCARQVLPLMEQVFVQAAEHQGLPDFARQLFLARRRAEQSLASIHDFYITTLSPYCLAYKGMVVPADLARFYLDLQHPSLMSSAVIFHQRFSTNTQPRWSLAHPFRFLAHNGEINTIAGNRQWAQARSRIWKTPFFDLTEFDSVIAMSGSDSQSLDNMLEMLIAGGMDLLQALRILIPPALPTLQFKNPDLAAFYEFYGLHSEPWDGPAGIVALDGQHAACLLDRNGLRPARWLLTCDRYFMVASESGVWDLPSDQIIRKGRLSPGEMLAINFQNHSLLKSEEIDQIHCNRAPFKQWLDQGVTYLQTELIDQSLIDRSLDQESLQTYQKLFQLTHEEIEYILKVLAEQAQEPTGSMGDDTPLFVLSQRTRPLYDSFRQAFAQVTNPPIDPLREGLVMSLSTQLGREKNIFEMSPSMVNHVIVNSPVLSQRKRRELLQIQQFASCHAFIALDYAPEQNLVAHVHYLCTKAESLARQGHVLLILTDRYPTAGRPVAHALLATGAVHQHLCRVGLRCHINLLVETGTARDAHHMACLLGVGATAVYPYLAYDTLNDLDRTGRLTGPNPDHLQEFGRRYRSGINKGLAKIISKMGISTIASYRGAQLFEIIGLDQEVVSFCFPNAIARVGGLGWSQLDQDARQLVQDAWDQNRHLDMGGLIRYVHGGEYHMFNPQVIMCLQQAVRTGQSEHWQSYTQAVHSRPPSTLRDLFQPTSTRRPLPLTQVAPIAHLLHRFDTAAISLGSLSPEAHEALATAMNQLGGRSNSGEGGEDPNRYHSPQRSKIKQIASGRFGVTPDYLVNADVLQIKIAQGAKPGEGGQLPGHKVNALIARLRFASPGIALISPPPHHDIYSIEDLAQLIYDLREINPNAQISVKLVAHAGVGTIAMGVVKAGADLITISGYDGGTGASPISSIRHTGIPWEMGLAETHQTLVANGLRSRVCLQVDGGLKTGLDVIKAAAIGAESFGFGTAPLIVLGCKYLRICHLNNCATGIATQDERLRHGQFSGQPERVVHFFRLLAEEVRQWLAALGLSSIDCLIGHPEYLQQQIFSLRPDVQLDLAAILAKPPKPDISSHDTHIAYQESRDQLSVQMERHLGPIIAARQGGTFQWTIHNTDRAIGARLAGAIIRQYGRELTKTPITIQLRGSAGQSFGAFNVPGLQFDLEGEANDYVGKGMAGGRLVIHPPQDAPFEARYAPILGNTCLYGATGGELYAAGCAGERFAVRNSGATAVIEGAGDHCCEYMTAGLVVILGKVGHNFGAGLTGGLAYVLDIDRDFVDRYNHELIDIHPIFTEGFANHRQHLHRLLNTHHRLTGSVWAKQILAAFRDFIGKFWLVKPRAASLQSLTETLHRAA